MYPPHKDSGTKGGVGWSKNESGGEGATSPPRGPITVQAVSPVCCWCLGIRLGCSKASAHFPAHAHAHTHLHPRHTIRPRNAHCDGAANVGLYTSRSTVVACGHGHWSAGTLGAVHDLIPTSLPHKTTWSRTKQCTVAGHRSHISTIVHACTRGGLGPRAFTLGCKHGDSPEERRCPVGSRSPQDTVPCTWATSRRWCHHRCR
jgi:hypothetical protein